MFTGIIETVGVVAKMSTSATNISFWIESDIVNELKIDQSIAHNGACLTVEEIESNTHKVTAVGETLSKTHLSSIRNGSRINLERCLLLSGRLDGHFVQGHVDTTGMVILKLDMGGSWHYTFMFPPTFAPLVIEKGSITVNGISLTAFNVTEKNFTVAIIPYTYQHTNIHRVETGDLVNIEFDMLGKYMVRKMELEKE